MPLLNSGVLAHVLTTEERSRGGQAVKFNNVRHGRFAEKLSSVYVCPDCNTPIPVDKVLAQDALMMKLATKRDLYERIKVNIVRMESLLSVETGNKEAFAMLVALNQQLLKLVEQTAEEPQKKAGELTIQDLMEAIIASDGKSVEKLSVKPSVI